MSASVEEAQSSSNQTFLSALVLNSLIAGAEIVGFIILRRYFRKVYQPRSYLPTPTKRSEPLSPGWVSWIPQIIMADEEQIIHHNGLDAYCFLRFLRLLLNIFTPIFVLSWAILLPVYSVNSGGAKTGLDQFTFGNIGLDAQIRLTAPLVLAYVFTFYVLYLLKVEIQSFIGKRQTFLTSDGYRSRQQSRTVLLTGIPKDLLDSDALRRFTAHLPGGARQVWIARDIKDLPDIYERQQNAFSKLEGAYASLISTAHKAHQKNQKNSKAVPEVMEDGHEWSKHIPRSKRPTHKLGFLGLVGKKVDSIDWASEEVLETSKELSNRRTNMEDYKPVNAAFVEFNNIIAAHLFAQSLAHHTPLQMHGKWLDVAAEDVIWSNLSMDPLQQRIRALISWAITIALIVFWALPVAFVGLISNVSSLCAKVFWMAWLCKLPPPVPGIIQGVLPPVMLAVLFILLPIFLRLLAKFQGIPLNSHVELSLMSRYFTFLVIHGFLIVTLSSGLVAAIPAITQQPTSAATILAQQLPKASNFFLTYFVTTCFAGAAGSLLQIAGVVVYNLKLKFLTSTPRSVYTTRCGMSSVQWGTLFPNMTLLAVIAISYSIVSPILNGFALVGFALFWFVYKYLFIFVMDLPSSSETGGKFFPLAIRQMFIGLYIGEVFLAALFFLAQDASKKQSGVIHGALMIVLVFITMFFQSMINKDYFPLIDYLPVSLAGQALGAENEEGSSHKSDEPIVEKDLKAIETPEELEHHFDHPAQWKNVGVLWIADDELLKIGEDGVRQLQASGLKASSNGAKFTSQGDVIVTRSPPDAPEAVEIPPSD
ncbi:hypothetical protein PTTG_09825 [Puccinia triticina 1-1 BBBD Race 1]|uniref:DUF221-domain-containing protein n=2 Tax=Puccinia triticina TaxID=208348 RepID=A0A180H105_PUCT1|nr:uncharacterized protein PtA15_2A899 [Puccinia triticina]OAV98725.1 hypothetical protein PTTG_09825 [Puccinia triticina 1-1 BBBD Race 1]WAQ82582.1 hypothetical protein PtA15_2A899 [Puccinia triticina]